MARATWHPGARPAWVTAAIDGAVDPLLEAARVPFDVEALCDEASLLTGSTDFGPDDFRTPLRVLLHSAEHEADLHVVGRLRFRETVLRLLAGRLRLRSHLSRDPGVLDEVVAAPVVVTGSPRSGTSILHQLLACDPSLRAPLSWEFWCPTPPPDPATRDSDPRIALADLDLRMSGKLAPDFQGMHEMSSTMTRECLAAQAYSFRTDDFSGVFSLPGYEDYLATADMGPAYHWHRLVLKVLQRSTPGTRWVLKAPSHLAALDDLFATYPDAQLIVTHRDPLEVLSSVCSLLATLQWGHSNRIDVDRLVRSQIDRHAGLLDGLVDWREAHPEVPVHDVDYSGFLADPIGTVASVRERQGSPLDAAARAAMTSYLQAHPQGRDGGHRHDVAALGVDEQALRARFARYTEAYGLG